MPTDIPQSTDVVFVDTLRVEADIGADCWGKERAQPVEITVYLHLNPDYLEAAGNSDDVVDSVHYGHLTKTISSLIKSRAENKTPFKGVDDLIREVAKRALDLGKEAVDEVRVVVEVPKLILLAHGFSVDVTISRRSPEVFVSKKVSVKDIVVPVIIGVNPPEREAKQRVLVNVIFYENDDPLSGPSPDYPEVVKVLVKVSLLPCSSCFASNSRFYSGNGGYVVPHP